MINRLNLTKKELMTISVVILLLMVVFNADFVIGYLKTPAQHVYLGLNSQSPADLFVYYSYINQVKNNNFFIYDLYTSENQPFGIFNILWFLVGGFAKIFNLSAIISFHLARIIFGCALLYFLYFLASYFLKKAYERITFFLLMLGSGIGGFFALTMPNSEYVSHGAGYLWPIDIWPITHAFIISAIRQSPHVIASIILEVAILLFGFLSFINNKYKYSVFAGFLALILFNFHPYYYPAIFVILGIFLYLSFFINFKKTIIFLKHYLIIFLISLPSLIYHFWILKNNFVLNIRGMQNISLLPPAFYIVAGFGFLLLLSAAGVFLVFQRRDFSATNLFMFCWLAGSILLILPKVQFQARYLQTLIIPISFFSAIFLFFVFNLLKKKINKKIIFVLAVGSYIFLIFFSNLINLARDFFYFKSYPDFFYSRQEYLTGISWLKNNLSDKDLIISSSDTGLFIPAFSAKKVFVGHGHETLNFSEKKQKAQDFFNSKIEAKNFLSQNNISYIFIGPNEKKFGFDAEAKDYLEKKYSNNLVEIYKINLDQHPP